MNKDDFIPIFNENIEDCENYLCITRAPELQREACSKLEVLRGLISSEMQLAIEGNDEDYANLLLGCQCVASAVGAEIRMWLMLKDDKPDDAWDQLVTAQMATVDAVRAHDAFQHLERNSGRLEAIERLVFPPQVFFSSGMLVRSQECSICGQEYEDCDHLIGKPYMGKFCYIIARDIDLDHVSIVKQPADKRCRAIQFSDGNGTRNKMTWRLDPPSNEDNLPTPHTLPREQI